MVKLNSAYQTPVFDPSDPLVCHSIQLRPSLWAVVFNALELLGEEWSWRQDDPASATVQEVITEMTNATIDAIFRGCIMIGQVLELAIDCPDWCLECDGAVYLNTDYPELAAVIDPAYIVDGTHFRVPDHQARFALGGVLLGDSGGESSHVITTAEMPSHYHTQDQFGTAASVVLGELPGVEIVPVPGITGSTGGGDAMPIMPPYEIVRKVIVARLPNVP